VVSRSVRTHRGPGPGVGPGKDVLHFFNFFEPVDLNLSFGEHTREGLAPVAPTIGEPITSTAITDATGHWQATADGLFSPSAAGAAADLNLSPYTVPTIFNGLPSQDVILTTVENGYSINPDDTGAETSLDITCTDMKVRFDGGKTLLFRPGIHQLPSDNTTLFRDGGFDRDYLNHITITSHDITDQVNFANVAGGVASAIRSARNATFINVKMEARHDGAGDWVGGAPSAFPLVGEVAGTGGLTFDTVDFYGHRTDYQVEDLGLGTVSDYIGGIVGYDGATNLSGVLTFRHCRFHGADTAVRLPDTKAVGSAIVFYDNDIYDFGLDVALFNEQDDFIGAWNRSYSPYAESIEDDANPGLDLLGHGDNYQLNAGTVDTTGLKLWANKVLSQRVTPLPIGTYPPGYTGYGQKSAFQAMFLQGNPGVNLVGASVVGNFLCTKAIHGIFADRGEPENLVFVANTMMVGRDMLAGIGDFPGNQPIIYVQGTASGGHLVADNVTYSIGVSGPGTLVDNNQLIDQNAVSGSLDYATNFDNNGGAGGSGGDFAPRTTDEISTVFKGLAGGPLEISIPKRGPGNEYVNFSTEVIDHPRVNTTNAFAFPDLTGQPANTLVETPTGTQITSISRFLEGLVRQSGASVNGALITVSGGISPEIKVTSDAAGLVIVTAYTATDTIIANSNHYIWVRDTSSPSDATQTDIIVNVGDAFDTWSITTSASLPTTGLIGRFENDVSNFTLDTGDEVDVWDDTSVSAEDMTGTGVTRPIHKDDVFGGYVDFGPAASNMQLEFDPAASFDPQDGTIYVVFRSDQETTTNQVLVNLGDIDLAIYSSGIGLLTYYDGGNRNSDIYIGDGVQTLMFRGGATESEIRLGPESWLRGASAAAGTITGGRLGVWQSNLFDQRGEILAVFKYDHEQSNGDVDLVLDYCSAQFGALAKDETTYMVCSGDSLTAGVGSTDLRHYSWPAQMAALNVTQTKFTNPASGGSTIDTTATEAIDGLNRTPVTEYADRLATFLWGTNDISNGDSSATVITAIDTWITSVSTAHADAVLVGLTITPRSDFSGAQNTILAAVNAHILGSAAFDITVDIASDPDLDDPTDLTYYDPDGIHYTDAGSGVVASLMDTALAVYLP